MSALVVWAGLGVPAERARQDGGEGGGGHHERDHRAGDDGQLLAPDETIVAVAAGLLVFRVVCHGVSPMVCVGGSLIGLNRSLKLWLGGMISSLELFSSWLRHGAGQPAFGQVQLSMLF